MKQFSHAFISSFHYFLPLAAGLFLVSGIIYVTVQQNYRQSANDPQIQLAEDAAAQVASGVEPEQAIPAAHVNLQQSLAPWIGFYSEQGEPIVTSGELNGAPARPPRNLFDESTWLFTKTYSTLNGKETRITWQPEEGVRQALVLVHVSTGKNTGFIASGRSLREVESREAQLSLTIFFGLCAALLATFVATILAQMLL